MNRASVLTALAFIVALAACATAPAPVLVVQPDLELTGYWAIEATLEGSSLLLSRPLDGVYPTRFSSSGCLGSEVRQVTARFVSGYLTLSEPVLEYSGRTLHRLALYESRGTLFLVPEPNVPDIQFESARRGSQAAAEALESFAYRRLSAIP